MPRTFRAGLLKVNQGCCFQYENSFDNVEDCKIVFSIPFSEFGMR